MMRAHLQDCRYRISRILNPRQVAVQPQNGEQYGFPSFPPESAVSLLAITSSGDDLSAIGSACRPPPFLMAATLPPCRTILFLWEPFALSHPSFPAAQESSLGVALTHRQRRGDVG
jgi:hypothetical protein